MVIVTNLCIEYVSFQILKRLILTMSGNNDMIRLNVGGKVFLTNLSTLQSCPSSSLAMMFSPSSPHQLPATDSTGAFFLDSSPDMFGFVLDWCRYNQLVVDRDNMDWSGLDEAGGEEEE